MAKLLRSIGNAAADASVVSSLANDDIAWRSSNASGDVASIFHYLTAQSQTWNSAWLDGKSALVTCAASTAMYFAIRFAGEMKRDDAADAKRADGGPLGLQCLFQTVGVALTVRDMMLGKGDASAQIQLMTVLSFSAAANFVLAEGPDYILRKFMNLTKKKAKPCVAFQQQPHLMEVISKKPQSFTRSLVEDPYFYMAVALTVAGKSVWSTPFFAGAAAFTVWRAKNPLMPEKIVDLLDNKRVREDFVAEARTQLMRKSKQSFASAVNAMVDGLSGLVRQKEGPLNVMTVGCGAGMFQNLYNWNFHEAAVMALYTFTLYSIHAWKKNNGMVETIAQLARPWRRNPPATRHVPLAEPNC